MFFVFQPTEFEEKAVKKVDDLLESYMGIRDTELGEYKNLRATGTILMYVINSPESSEDDLPPFSHI